MKIALVLGAMVILAAILAPGFRARADAAEPGPPATFAERYHDLSRDVLDRKAISDARLRAEGVPVNEWLPAIESEGDVRLPTTEEVAMRAVATVAVAAKAMGMPKERLDAMIRGYQLTRWFSPAEAAFMAAPEPTEEERVANSWRIEAAYALLWSIGYVDHLDAPKEPCDPPTVFALIEGKSRDAFLTSATLRPASAILDQADLIYRYRWALVDARLKSAPPPAGLDDDVAMERHQAFNWLLEHDETAWDDITLDT